MEDSKAQQKIIDLGKTIVNELELDRGVDTLAKWMSHYVAEKIESAEKLSGKEKEHAQKECFETILKLWEHRWSIPRDKPFLKDFESLFETLEKLYRKKRTPVFFLPEIQDYFKGKNDKEATNGAKSHFDTALRVDLIARSLIYDLLNKAVAEIELTGNRGELIRNAIDLIDYPDTRIIRFISNYDEIQEIKGGDETKMRINELQKRINDLEEFTSIRDSLLNSFKQQLSEIEK